MEATETVGSAKAQELSELGFTAAASKLKQLETKKRKLAIAYEHFRFVRQEKIDAFNNKLRTSGTGMGWKMLSFTAVSQYEEIPPAHVLLKMAEAKEQKCFDAFEVAHIVEVKDPILFGRVNGCSDRFFIDQWDNDVKIEDLLMPSEG